LLSVAALFPSPELFFGLNASLNWLLEEDRFERSSGGSRLVRLRSSDGADSRLSELSLGNVDDRVGFLDVPSDPRGSELRAGCARGDDVVESPSRDEWAEMAVGRWLELLSERE
jgi:hypothetical protein